MTVRRFEFEIPLLRLLPPLAVSSPSPSYEGSENELCSFMDTLFGARLFFLVDGSTAVILRTALLSFSVLARERDMLRATDGVSWISVLSTRSRSISAATLSPLDCKKGIKSFQTLPRVRDRR